MCEAARKVPPRSDGTTAMALPKTEGIGRACNPTMRSGFNARCCNPSSSTTAFNAGRSWPCGTSRKGGWHIQPRERKQCVLHPPRFITHFAPAVGVGHPDKIVGRAAISSTQNANRLRTEKVLQALGNVEDMRGFACASESALPTTTVGGRLFGWRIRPSRTRCGAISTPKTKARKREATTAQSRPSHGPNGAGKPRLGPHLETGMERVPSGPWRMP